MRNKLMEIIVCPRCLVKLKLLNEKIEKGEIVEATLRCENCDLNFLIKDKVAIFGIKEQNASERNSEIVGENKWVSEANELQDHVKYAEESSPYVEKLIPKISKICKNRRELRVLDVGAGWGAFQSWQFSKHGFEVVAIDLVPEFLFATDYVINKGVFFERVVTDSTLLPFEDHYFDVVFCKEIVHHINNPLGLISELSRVASENAVFVINEPCISVFVNKEKAEKEGRAVAVGIKHRFYTYLEFKSIFDEILSDTKITGTALRINPIHHPILSRIQNDLTIIANSTIFKPAFLRNFVLKIQLILLGGVVEFIGLKTRDLKVKMKRDVIPIDVGRVDYQQVKTYEDELIPAVFKIYLQAHEKYKQKADLEL